MIKIVNKRYTKMQGEYIGRPSPLGNPFVIGKDGTREEVIARYEKDLRTKLIIGKKTTCNEFFRLVELAKAGNLVLVCHCKPLPCHGDIIKKLIEEILHV